MASCKSHRSCRQHSCAVRPQQDHGMRHANFSGREGGVMRIVCNESRKEKKMDGSMEHGGGGGWPLGCRGEQVGRAVEGLTKTVEGFAPLLRCRAAPSMPPWGTFFIGGGRHGKQRLAFFSCPPPLPGPVVHGWTRARGTANQSRTRRVIMPDRPGTPLTHRASKGPSSRPPSPWPPAGRAGVLAAGAGVPSGRPRGNEDDDGVWSRMGWTPRWTRLTTRAGLPVGGAGEDEGARWTGAKFQEVNTLLFFNWIHRPVLRRELVIRRT